MTTEKNTVRIDKYLWAVRLFKTRSLSSQMCKKSHITINNIPVKSSRLISKNTEFKIKEHFIERTYKVIEVLEKRVGAKLVSNYLQEITPKEELEKLELIKLDKPILRNKGLGRPTKKERRDLGHFFK